MNIVWVGFCWWRIFKFWCRDFLFCVVVILDVDVIVCFGSRFLLKMFLWDKICSVFLMVYLEEGFFILFISFGIDRIMFLIVFCKMFLLKGSCVFFLFFLNYFVIVIELKIYVFVLFNICVWVEMFVVKFELNLVFFLV